MTRQRTWIFVLVCALAGSLSVPLDPIATPLAAIVAGLLGLLGLRVWRWSGLPSVIASEAEPRRARRLLEPVFFLTLGLLLGLTLLAVIRLVIEPRLPPIGLRIEAAGALPIWRRAAIIYVAAVAEELIFRVVLFSLIVGVAIRWGRAGRVPTPAIVWGANVVSALAFAAVHLPAWSGMASTVALPLAVLALNTAGGLVIGRVFAMRGIAAAMWTHAGGDCAIQLIGPLTG